MLKMTVTHKGPPLHCTIVALLIKTAAIVYKVAEERRDFGFYYDGVSGVITSTKEIEDLYGEQAIRFRVRMVTPHKAETILILPVKIFSVGQILFDSIGLIPEGETLCFIDTDYAVPKSTPEYYFN